VSDLNSSFSPKLNSWSIGDLGAFYVKHKRDLLAHANRLLKDTARAEEVVQDALVKFMLAAPELSSEAHAVSYLHRAIENLCMDVFRIEGRRPKLVVIDDATSELESTWQQIPDHSDLISAADDAAIIREALSMLSPAERTALVMWEMDSRSTKEIADELGIKEATVRHTVSRARASLRKVLSTLIIDEKRGLTALDVLSTSYKKTKDIAQKSGRVAMSLVLLVAAFLGFNSMTGSEPIQTVVSAPTVNPEESVTVSEDDAAVKVPEPVKAIEESEELEVDSDVLAELDFYNAQLESAAVMLETLQLIEGKQL